MKKKNIKTKKQFEVTFVVADENRPCILSITVAVEAVNFEKATKISRKAVKRYAKEIAQGYANASVVEN